VTWKILAVAAMLCSSAAALGQSATTGLSERYTACQGRAGGNTVQQAICAQTEIAGQDARLNKAYQQVMRQFATKPEQRTALRNPQRSWLKARDYDCKVDQQTIDSKCIVIKTAVRANELESQIRS
jgi:uncharacterized protein YecT (DUF1311 family)